MSVYTKISHLVENMFPSFYKEEGPDFIAFVTAYIEWLESNHQLLTLEHSKDFNVGDTVTQDQVTGTIIARTGKDILVHVDGIETFKCFTVCSSLIPVTSTSGGSSYILKGGTTRRLGTLFYSRNLPEMFDIDSTLDLFINHFKLKYLHNIEFDAKTNKRLLVKHSLDLYRSKGTERSIDLFFRLVYGAKTKVYYPGDDLFKLSEGEWIKPKYIEIKHGSDTRAVSLVGKQVKGATSGASAFVEKFIKRKVNGDFANILYISNITGEFINNELIYSDVVYPDSPKVAGSLTSAEIISGGRLFNVGDIVDIQGVSGKGAIGRVAEVSNKTGVADFLLNDTGYGYTVNPDIRISDKVLSLTNVAPGNLVAGFTVTTAGLGYSNGDLIVVQSPTTNATARISTLANGAVNFVTLKKPGAGFITLTPNVYITNATGGTSTGSGANLAVGFTEPNSYFTHMESVIDTTGTGVGVVVGDPYNYNVDLKQILGTVPVIGDIVYQNNASNKRIGQARVKSSSATSMELDSMYGIFKPNVKIYSEQDATFSATIKTIYMQVGIDITSGSFVANSSTPVSTKTGISSKAKDVSNGSGASFNVGTLNDTEVIVINTDYLSNSAFRATKLNANNFNIAGNTSANSSTKMLAAMSFATKTIGSINSLTNINPGSQYNVPPLVVVQEPALSNHRRYDYIINTTGQVGTTFIEGETIVQESVTLNKFDLLLTDETGYKLGEVVYQGTIGSETAKGKITKIVPAANTVTVGSVTGTFATAVLKSRLNAALAANVTTITPVTEFLIAKGKVKKVSNNDVYVKRIQFDNNFVPGLQITGSASGGSAYIVSIQNDMLLPTIGHNANVSANVLTANGSVTSLQIVDSGYGYANSEIITFTDANGQFSGQAKMIVSGSGTGSGYYMKERGTISSTSKIHDGDYYQEYSYDILSKIAFDKYAAMFKKVMHTAGTRFFGSILIDDTADIITNVTSEFSNTHSDTLTFTRSDIVSSFITVSNNHFVNATPLTYYTGSGVTGISRLSNNATYYTYGANSTGTWLTTNPRFVSANIDGSLVSNNYIYSPRHNFKAGDVIMYTTNASALGGLSNNTVYVVKTANNDYIGLSLTQGGSAITINASANVETGHNLIITKIPISTSNTVGNFYLTGSY